MLNKYRYGIEIECIVPQTLAREFSHSIQDLGIQVGSDESIKCDPNEYALELRTLPLSLTQSSHLLGLIEYNSKKYQVRVNESCGLHVHTSSPKFSNNDNLRRILGLWVAIEDVMFATQPESRLNSKYCQRRLASYAVAGFPKLPEAKQKMLNELGQSNRYFALNFASLKKHGTLECRLHAGTLDAEKIINWMKLLKAFYDYALDSYNSLEVNKLFLLSTCDEKIQKVWKLLKLSKELKTHFDNRIEKFMLPRLALQQEKAKELISYRLRTAKIEIKLQKEKYKGYKIEENIRKKANKMIRTADEKAKEILDKTYAIERALKTQKKRLLQEFVGEDFKGDIEDFINSWKSSPRDEFVTDVATPTFVTDVATPTTDSPNFYPFTRLDSSTTTIIERRI